jgi:dihydropteroate synthase
VRVGARTFAPHDAAVVGVLNVTPDSFSDGGELASLDAVRARAATLVADGADMLDIGGESTRPGASPVDVELELERVVPAVRAARAVVDVPLSVDTRRAVVADAALRAGAVMVNDVSGFADPAMAAVVREHDAAWVLMHMPHAVGAMAASKAAGGMPAGVRAGVARIARDLRGRVDAAVQAGVGRDRLAIDPGIGFGKSLLLNVALCAHVEELAALGLPLYLGPSRKSFLGVLTGRGPDERVAATAAAVTSAVLAGARFVRVHDVAAMRDVVKVALAIRDVRGGGRDRG